MATKDFINYSPDSGNKNATVSVTTPANSGGARSTFLNITGKGITRVVQISQKELPLKNYIVVGGLNSGIICKIKT